MQDVTYCPDCFALVLTEYEAAHRDYHEEQDKALTELVGIVRRLSGVEVARG